MLPVSVIASLLPVTESVLLLVVKLRDVLGNSTRMRSLLPVRVMTSLFATYTLSLLAVRLRLMLEKGEMASLLPMTVRGRTPRA